MPKKPDFLFHRAYMPHSFEPFEIPVIPVTGQASPVIMKLCNSVMAHQLYSREQITGTTTDNLHTHSSGVKPV